MNLNVLRIAAASALVALGSGVVSVGSAGAAADATSDIAPSIHGAVETQAVTVGQGALSLLIDPSTAYAYSVLDKEEGVNYSMTARGANLNLGADLYAKTWEPPNCAASNISCYESGSYDKNGVNTGLHEARGFPFYSEALYPPPPAPGISQERVYKCVLTKDGPGAVPTGGGAGETCRQLNNAPGANNAVPFTTWAETMGNEMRSTGFSRGGGLDVPGIINIAASESFAEVRALPGKKAISTGYSNVSGVSLLGGLIKIDSVRSTGTVTGNSDDLHATASCEVAGLTVMGQRQGTDASSLASPALQKQLDQIAAQTGYVVKIVPPTGPITGKVDRGKTVASCNGLMITFVDTHQQVVPVSIPNVPLCADHYVSQLPPSCVPALGTREELSLGRLSVQQAVNTFSLFDFSNDAGGPAVPDATGGLGSAPATGTDTGPATLVAAAGAGAVQATAPSIDTSGGAGAAVPATSGGKTGAKRVGGNAGKVPLQTAAAHRPYNPKLIGGLTAGAVGALVIGVLLLIGVVDAVASGRPFRLPGL